MYKLVLILFMCMYSAGSGANSTLLPELPAAVPASAEAEPLEVLNPFMLCRN